LMLHVLYASGFQSASGILRWQLFGDILKIVGWAVGFMLLARKARGAYFLAELSWNICYIALAWPLTSLHGLSGLGIAYTVSYAFYALVTLWLARRETGFSFQGRTFALVVALLLVGGATLWSVENGSSISMYTGATLASGVTIASFLIIHNWRERERRDKNETSIPIRPSRGI
jgi:enterobacterial common antigen flippase